MSLEAFRKFCPEEGHPVLLGEGAQLSLTVGWGAYPSAWQVGYGHGPLISKVW